MQKADLRRSLLKTRQSLSASAWRDKSDRLCAHLHNWPGFAAAHTVLAYFSVRQEPDLSPLFTSAQRWGFPRCAGTSLVWHQWSPEQPLISGSYGIPEPLPCAPSLHPGEVDLILVPAVACDRQGYRLGYGGGFYDRLLSDPEWSAIPTMGIVFDFARLDRLPIDSWDRPLRGVCTEAGRFLVG